MHFLTDPLKIYPKAAICNIMMTNLCWYYSAVIMPYNEEFVSSQRKKKDQEEEEFCVTNSSEEFVYMRNLCVQSFISIIFGFQETEKYVPYSSKKKKEKYVP